jgi:hypothetical protein
LQNIEFSWENFFQKELNTQQSMKITPTFKVGCTRWGQIKSNLVDIAAQIMKFKLIYAFKPNVETYSPLNKTPNG